MNKIKPEAITGNAFELIGKDWMLICARGRDGRVNAMTASWGGFGVLWGKRVAFVFIRPQRFTKKLVDEADRLTLNFFGGEYRSMLNYMGKASGAEEDKIARSGLSVAECNGAPYFNEASMAMICKKLYRGAIEQECFIDRSLIGKWYPQNDFHDVYVVEIEEVFKA